MMRAKKEKRIKDNRREEYEGEEKKNWKKGIGESEDAYREEERKGK